MARLGDLPIFSATLNRVRVVTSDPESDAVELADEVLKDTSLTTKLIRLANTRHYNRGMGKIGTISRAVVILGFETVKNACLTLKMLEDFKDEKSSKELQQLLTNAYMTATFVRDLAEKAGAKDIEQSYISGLLHNLGEIVIAYFMPEQYSDMLYAVDSTGISWKDAQTRFLGASLNDIAKELAVQWDFPDAIVRTLDRYDPHTSGTIRGDNMINCALASLGEDVMSLMYTGRTHNNLDYDQLTEKLAEVAGVKTDEINKSLTSSFKLACDLAENYGIDKRLLKPALEETSDSSRDAIARRLSYVAEQSISNNRDNATGDPEVNTGTEISGTGIEKTPAPVSGQNDAATFSEPEVATEPAGAVVDSKTSDTKFSGYKSISADTGTAENVDSYTSAAPGGTGHDIPAAASEAIGADIETDAEIPAKEIPHAPAGDMADRNAERQVIQLRTLQEITTLMTTSMNIQSIFAKVLDGIESGVGFDRAVLCLVSSDRSNYSGRISRGKNSDKLRVYLNFQINVKTDLFSKVIIENKELLVADINDTSYRDLMKKDFHAKTGASSFAVASLQSQGKPIAMIYADKAMSQHPISEDEYRGFIQFISQARLALQMIGLTNMKK